MPRKKKRRIGCFHRLTEGESSYCVLQSNRFIEDDRTQRAFVFQGTKEGLLFACDQEFLQLCPFHAESGGSERSKSGHLIPCPYCKRRHFEGSTAKRLCEEWSSVKQVLKQMRQEQPEGRRYYSMGTIQLPYSDSTPDLVRRLIWIRLKSAVLRRDHYVCQDCGDDFGGRRRKIFDPNARRGEGGHVWESLEVHHIIPRSRQGSDHPGNLMTLCPACHRKYTTELMVDIVGERGKERELIRRMRELPDEREVWDFRGE